MTEAELAGVVCARICHDLASPIGAIVNGADLIRELGGFDASEELALVEQSALRAAAVLKFHRLAFGSHSDPDAAIGRDELRARIAAILSGTRVKLDWTAPEGPALGLSVARLLGLMVLAGRAMLGAAGALQVLLPAEAALPAAVLAIGPKAAATEAQRNWLSGDHSTPPESRQVEFALIAPAARAAGARLELIEDRVGQDGRVALRARLA